MTPDDKLHAYLWEPSAPADAEVEALEHNLSSLRFDADARPLTIPPRAVALERQRFSWRRPLVAFAIAASLLVAAGTGLWMWRWNWPEGRPWTVRAGSFESRLQVGSRVTIPENDRAVANIARIGTMRLEGGTSLELRATRGTRHRLRMTAGDIHVRVWAPPVSVVVETPVGEVIDMGCEFVLSVHEGRSAVRVLSGWVQLENGIGEVLVPAGASAEMTGHRGPDVPVFDDAAAGFRESVRAFERGEEAGSIDRIVALARPRDVYTLLQLADRHPSAAETLLRRAAELSPPPEGITIASILRGNRQNLWRWSSSLPLPPPKGSWWRNWRDAFPLSLSER